MIPQYFLDEMVLFSPTFLKKRSLNYKKQKRKVNQSYNLFLF